MSVKRYDFDCITSDYLLGASLDRSQVPDGDYVTYEDYASLASRHRALVEAVEWERETDDCGEWLHIAWWDNPKIDLLDIWDIHHAARAKVDRLLKEDKN